MRVRTIKTSDLDFELPNELIAQNPPESRGASKLMYLPSDRGSKTDDCSDLNPNDGGFFVDYFESLFPRVLLGSDLIVRNTTKVIPARLFGTRPSGGKCELLLLEPDETSGSNVWKAMAKPSRKLTKDMPIHLSENSHVRCVESLGDGMWLIELPVDDERLEGWLLSYGKTPLPPYINEIQNNVAERYQSVWASSAGSVAAPTASLHFSEDFAAMLDAIHDVVDLTLHVGPGTFLPVKTESLDEHQMHSERFSIPSSSHHSIQQALDDGRRIVAIGSTVVRVLESVYGSSDQLEHDFAQSDNGVAGRTSAFIKPGYEFSAVDAMLTNFHLPKSTLLAMVMAFAGEQNIRAAYRQAIDQKMRFFSFGDAMFIERAR